jgi:hypothetical protein
MVQTGAMPAAYELITRGLTPISLEIFEVDFQLNRAMISKSYS